MSQIPENSSSSEGKGKRYFYTVRNKDISDHAEKILKNAEEAVLSEIQWTDVTKGACNDADCLIVFKRGSSSANREDDVLCGIREQAPSVKSIIAVIICTNNSMEHDKYCSSIEKHTFRKEKDISFEYLIFSDGRPHECSHNIGNRIDFQLKNIEKEQKKKEESKTRPKPAIDKKIRSKLNQLAQPRDDLKDLEKVIKKIAKGKLKDKEDLIKIARSKLSELAETGDNLKDLEEVIKKIEKGESKYEEDLIKAKSKLNELARTRDNLEELEEVIRQFKEEGLEDKGDLTKAIDSLEKKKLEKGLKDAIYKRRGLDKAIETTEVSKFKDELNTLLSKAKEVRDDSKDQGKYMFPVPKMNSEIIAELRGYKQPQQVINDVVLATFMLLGENKDNLQDWDTIRKLMGSQSEMPVKKSLLQRINDFDKNKQEEISDEKNKEKENGDDINKKMEISEDKKKEIQGILQKYTLVSVRQISSGAATLYEWISHHI